MWNSVQSLLRKKAKKARECALGQDGLTYAGDEENEEAVVQLESKVVQWLENSKLPTSMPKPGPRGVASRAPDVGQRKESMYAKEVSTSDVLYHPDFVDWSAVQIKKEDSKMDFPAPNAFQVLKDATESISKTFRHPFV
jgi:hypothetical protein